MRPTPPQFACTARTSQRPMESRSKRAATRTPHSGRGSWRRTNCSAHWTTGATSSVRIRCTGRPWPDRARLGGPFQSPPHPAGRRGSGCIQRLVGVDRGVVDRVDTATRHTTQVGEQRVLTLADGSVVTLNTDTQVLLGMTDSARRVVMDRGRPISKSPRPTSDRSPSKSADVRSRRMERNSTCTATARVLRSH